MKNHKNIYEFLNGMDMNFQDYEAMELNDMERQKIKKAFRKHSKEHFNYKRFSAVVAVMLLSIVIFHQTGLGKAAYAATASKLSEISYSIGKSLGIERNIEPYANIIDQVIEDRGVEVKLTDVIIDRDELFLSTIINTNEPVEGLNFDYDIFINGRKVNKYGATGVGGAIDGADTLLYSTYAVNIQGIDTTENVDMKIVLKNMTYYYPETQSEKRIPGKWKFEFAANGKELTASTNAVPLNYIFSIADSQYTLDEFRYNPVNQKIVGTVQNRVDHPYRIDLRGEDNFGNHVVFFLTSVSGEDVVFKYENLSGDLADDILSITLTPYAAKIPEQGKMSVNDWQQVGDPFTILLNQ